MLLGRKPGHIFHEAEDPAVDVLVPEHIDSLFYIGEGHALRGRHDDGALDGHFLQQGNMDVARSRGHIDQQVVQHAPVDLQNHLLQGAAGHGAAPDQRLPRLGEITHGHPLDAVFLQRDEKILSVHLFHLDGRAFRAGHDRDGRAVDVGIGEADAVALTGQGDGEVHRDGGLADAALSGGDTDDVADVVDVIQREFRLFFLRGGGPDDAPDFYLRPAGQFAVERRLGSALQVVLQRVRAFREGQRDADLAFQDGDFVHQPQLNDAPVLLSGVHDGGEDLQDLFFFHYFTNSSSAIRRSAPPSFSTRKST